MAEEKEYGLLIAAIVAIVSIVGLVILFSRGAPVAKVISGSSADDVFYGRTPEMERGYPVYQQCEANSNCPTGQWCKNPQGVWECQPTDYSDSPQGYMPTASGRGDFVA